MSACLHDGPCDLVELVDGPMDGRQVCVLGFDRMYIPGSVGLAGSYTPSAPNRWGWKVDAPPCGVAWEDHRCKRDTGHDGPHSCACGGRRVPTQSPSMHP